MHSISIEQSYPADFRKSDTARLANYIKSHHSVEVLGMKRVGISNFLRFFVFNKNVDTDLHKDPSHIFIYVDLNDLIECEIHPFWLLTFKRLIDHVQESVEPEIVLQVQNYFERALQAQNHLITLDALRDSISLLTRNDYTLTIFLVRYDRILEAITPEFLNNIKGLYDASSKKLVFVTTLYRKLSELKPNAYHANNMSTFVQSMYIKPANKKDSESIYAAFSKHYDISLKSSISSKLIQHSAGHVQYLQLTLIKAFELLREGKKLPETFLKDVCVDERIDIQSEELLSHLNEQERDVLISCFKKEKISAMQKKEAKYLFDTGMLKKSKTSYKLFSAYLFSYLSRRTQKPVEEDVHFTSKEKSLFETLKNKKETIVEREDIIKDVWAEYSAIGVSDWAVDRLVARLRAKLRTMKSPYTIETIRTRGFMLKEINT